MPAVLLTAAINSVRSSSLKVTATRLALSAWMSPARTCR